MMKKPSIAIFCVSNEQTEEELALFQKYAYYSPVGYNVSNLSDGDFLVFDGACGAVPERYQGVPTADEIIKEYEDYLATLGVAVGGKAPEAPKRGRATASVGFSEE